MRYFNVHRSDVYHLVGCTIDGAAVLVDKRDKSSMLLNTDDVHTLELEALADSSDNRFNQACEIFMEGCAEKTDLQFLQRHGIQIENAPPDYSDTPYKQ